MFAREAERHSWWLIAVGAHALPCLCPCSESLRLLYLQVASIVPYSSSPSSSCASVSTACYVDSTNCSADEARHRNQRRGSLELTTRLYGLNHTRLN